MHCRAKGALARVNFFRNIFFCILHPELFELLPCFFVNIMKDIPSQQKTTQLRERISMYTSIYMRMLGGKTVIKK